MAKAILPNIKVDDLAVHAKKEYTVVEVNDDHLVMVLTEQLEDEDAKRFRLSYTSEKFEKLFPNAWEEDEEEVEEEDLEDKEDEEDEEDPDDEEEDSDEDEEEEVEEEDEEEPAPKKSTKKEVEVEEAETLEFDWEQTYDLVEDFFERIGEAKGADKNIIVALSVVKSEELRMLCTSYALKDNLHMDYYKFEERVLSGATKVKRPENIDTDTIINFMEAAAKKGKKKFTDEDYDLIIKSVPVENQHYFFLMLDPANMIADWGNIGVKTQTLSYILEEAKK